MSFDGVVSGELSSAKCFKIRGNDELYKEAMQQSAKFNRKFINDRKARIPLLDAQTRITQSNCTLWNIEYLKKSPIKRSQVCSYSIKKWVKKRRPLFDKDFMASNKLTDLINEHDTDSNSNIKPSPYDQGNSNSHNGEFGNIWFEDSFDNTTYDEPDSDSERVSKRQKGGRKKGKRVAAEEKQFNCDKCTAKYKTKPGLSYHMQNSHGIVPHHHGQLTNKHINDLDENTNSVNGSIYDDGNSSHSLPVY